MTQVPNPWKAHLQGLIGPMTAADASVQKAYSDALGLLKSGAWVGPSATAFATDINGQQKSASSASSASLAAVRKAYNAEPDKVDSNAWQCHWHNLRPN